MTTRFASQGIEWTEPMKQEARAAVIEPLLHHIHDFEISLHLNPDGEGYEIWAVLQASGGSDQIVRRKGREFSALINDVGQSLAQQVSHKPRTRFTLNPLQLFLPVESVS